MSEASEQASPASIDAGAVLRFLGVSLPSVIESLQEAGADTWPKILAVATWLQVAAITAMNDLNDDLPELATVLHAAYNIACESFDRTNPGYLKELAEAGTVLVLVPPATSGSAAPETVN